MTRKIICTCLALLLCVSLGMPAFAAENDFVPSITYKPNPEVVPVEGEDGEEYIIAGKNFTQWSRVYINNNKVKPTYISGTQLTIDASALKNDATVVISQVGSNNTRFRDSNEYLFVHQSMEQTESAD